MIEDQESQDRRARAAVLEAIRIAGMRQEAIALPRVWTAKLSRSTPTPAQTTRTDDDARDTD